MDKTNKVKEIICAYCKKVFSVPIYEKFNSRRCCGYSCSNYLRHAHKIRPKCLFCDKTIVLVACSMKKRKYCNRECSQKSKMNRVELFCSVCDKKYIVNVSKGKSKFCSRKCMGVGNRDKHLSRKPAYRSYGECALLILLRKNFPNYSFISNDRIQLDGFEIDIWAPDLHVGIEYNGPHHYTPIYGLKVFQQTKKNDKAKRAIAFRKNIKIITIPVLTTTHKGNKSKILNIFKELCEQLLLTPKILDFNSTEVFTELEK